MTLSKITDHNGFLRIAAFDHRDSLKKYVDEENFAAFKKLITISFKDYISAILVDPFYGAQSIEAAENAQTGVILSREESGYTDNPDGRITTLTDLDSEKLKSIGANAIKLLLYFNPDAQNATEQIEILKGVHNESEKVNLPLILEPITYPLRNREYKKSREIIRTIERLLPFADVFKIEFPIDNELDPLSSASPILWRVSQILGTKPWVLLSRGAMDFDKYFEAVKLCMLNGAKGYAVGRAVWQEISELKTWEEKSAFIKTTGVERMKKLNTIV